MSCAVCSASYFATLPACRSPRTVEGSYASHRGQALANTTTANLCNLSLRSFLSLQFFYLERIDLRILR